MTSIKINQHGTCIPKTELTEIEIKKLKKDLNVLPETNFGNFPIKSFNVYIETKNFYILPIYYFLKEFDYKKYEIDFPINEKININNSISLRDYQEECFRLCMKEYDKKFGGGIISLPTGHGKCLGYNTKVLMYDGSIKYVQDIKKGDLIMGDDSTPRKILSTTSGEEEMYKIINKGDNYIVNKSHILSLKTLIDIVEKPTTYIVSWFDIHEKKCKCKSFYKEKYTLNDVIEFKEKIKKEHNILDINVIDYLNLAKYKKHILKGYKTAIEFPVQETPSDPYMLGYWLGDVSSYNISSNEKSVFNGKCNNSGKNIFLKTLKDYNLIKNKHIPMIYKLNSRENRLKLLAGIIDSNGNFSNNSYDIIQKNEKLNDDIVYLCRSLGFYVNISKYKNKYKQGIYFKCTIRGRYLEEIPVLCSRKKAKKSIFKRDFNKYTIKIKSIGFGKYYGFEIDGNRRFVLGDFTVTHNTVLSLKIISESKYKALIVVNKTELLNQWQNEIKKWLGDNVKIGIIQGKIFDYKNCDIVLGMLQTISIKKDLQARNFNWVDTCFIDEVHNISSQVFSNIMFKIRPRHVFGLTATIERKDKLEKVIKWYMGDILYDGRSTSLKQNSEIHQYTFVSLDLKEVTLRDGTPSVSTMLTNLANNKERNDLLLKIILELNKEPLRNILVISDRITQLKYLYNNLKKKEVSAGLFIGGLKKQELEESKTKKIILATYGLISEGVNIPKLNTLVFGTPRSSITQAIGRIYRQKHDITPIIIDIKDNLSLFPGQFYKRNTIYKKSINSPVFLSKKS